MSGVSGFLTCPQCGDVAVVDDGTGMWRCPGCYWQTRIYPISQVFWKRLNALAAVNPARGLELRMRAVRLKCPGCGQECVVLGRLEHGSWGWTCIQGDWQVPARPVFHHNRVKWEQLVECNRGRGMLALAALDWARNWAGGMK